MGRDTEPTVDNPASSSFYTEGKVLGGFILAATEYERRFVDGGETSIGSLPNSKAAKSNMYYDLQGRRVENPSKRGLYISCGQIKYI